MAFSFYCDFSFVFNCVACVFDKKKIYKKIFFCVLHTANILTRFECSFF